MKIQTWLRLERGRQASLAVHLGIKPPQVGDWLSGDKMIPIVHMAAIEAYTKGEVTRQEMCPDRWQHIWPELVQEQKTPAAQQTHAQPAIEAVAIGGA